MENNLTEDLNLKLKELSICEAGVTVDGQYFNWKGYLLEQQAKKRLEVSFYPPIKYGSDHTPHYEVTCVITYKNDDIFGIGSCTNVKVATQIAAKEAAEKWKLITKGIKKQQSIDGRNVVFDITDLQKFYTNLAINQELAAYLDRDKNNSQTLKKVLSLMRCKSEVILGNIEKSVLIKIMLSDNENITVMSVFAVSEQSIDAAKEKGEQKAISIIKILINN